MMSVLHEHLNRMEAVPVDKSFYFVRSIICHQESSTTLLKQLEQSSVIEVIVRVKSLPSAFAASRVGRINEKHTIAILPSDRFQ